MFRELINEANLSFLLHTKSPLMIKSAQGKLLDPTLPDMQCIKSRYQGKDTIIIPGSSLKGVIRSRYEKIIDLFGGKCCDIFNRENCCKKPKDVLKKIYQDRGKYVYQNVCPACQLFGSTEIASRISIADSYPVGEYRIGERAGVGINRITGAAQKGALYDYEVVEEGNFQVKIILKNYEIYQLVLLLYVLKDLNEGYVSLGAATTRGNGRMEVQELKIYFREYRKDVNGMKDAIGEQEILPDQKYHFEYKWDLPFYGEMILQDITVDDMISICKKIDIQSKVGGIHE